MDDWLELRERADERGKVERSSIVLLTEKAEARYPEGVVLC